MNTAFSGTIGTTKRSGPALLEPAGTVVARRRRSHDVSIVSPTPQHATKNRLEQRLRAMTLDEYIDFILKSGRYRVDFTNGTVFHHRRHVPLGHIRFDGYLSVALSHHKGFARAALAHRIIAIAKWGIDAVAGHEVGHRNGVRTENRLANLWIPKDRDEHAAHDNSRRGLLQGPRKESWAPCAFCGQKDGPMSKQCVTPERISGKRFGIDGKICHSCYDFLKRRPQSAQDTMAKCPSCGRLRPDSHFSSVSGKPRCQTEPMRVEIPPEDLGKTCRRGHSFAEHSYYRNGKRICCRTCEKRNKRLWARRNR